LASDVLAVARGAQANLKVTAERRGGFAEPVSLAVEGLPVGVSVGGTVLAAGQTTADLSFKADTKAALRGSRLTIRGSAKVGNRMVTETATLPAARGLPELNTVLLAVTLPTPFKLVGGYDLRWAPRGTVYHRRYRIERGGYQGSLEVRLADRQARHLQGVTGSTITVPAGAVEFDYAVQFPPWMETGRTARACVMAIGVIKDTDGSEHEVSFSSVAPDEQIIAVIEPGRLGVEPDRSSILAVPGKTVSLRVHVTRGKSLRGSVKLELLVAAHLRGISAESVVVSADQDRADLSIRCAADLRGPFNVPLIIRGTITEKGEPVTGEAKLDVQPGR
jgi:hypothetical protein